MHYIISGICYIILRFFNNLEVILKPRLDKILSDDIVESIITPDLYPQLNEIENKTIRDSNFVANGSRVIVNWGYGFYDKAGHKGVSLYLQGVQIIELAEQFLIHNISL